MCMDGGVHWLIATKGWNSCILVCRHFSSIMNCTDPCPPFLKRDPIDGENSWTDVVDLGCSACRGGAERKISVMDNVGKDKDV